jgi:hypothetical protein
MFGSLLRLGSKILGGMGIGGKMLSKGASLGRKYSGMANKAFDVVQGLPIVGHAIGSNPIFQGARGVVGGLGKVSDIASAAGDVLEKGSRGGANIGNAMNTGRALHGIGRNAYRNRANMFNRGSRDTNLGTTQHG